MRTVLASLAVFVASTLPVFARGTPIPEPGSFELLGIGAAGLVVAFLAGKRKK